MTEQWKTAVETDDTYEVSSFGQVRRKRDGLLLKPSIPRDSRDYPSVMLRHSGERKRVGVHRLVALNFLGLPPFAGAEVRHLDGDHKNPRWDNLAWGSRKDNAADRDRHGTTARGSRHGIHKRNVGGANNPNAGLSDEQVARIVSMGAAQRTQREIAAVVGCSQRTVWAVLSGKSYVAAALKAHAHPQPERDNGPE